MVRGKNLKLPRADVVKRILALVGTGRYTLVPGENGGADPEAESPYGPKGGADCIGVALYAQGLDRYQKKAFLPDPQKWDNRKHGKLKPGEAIYGGYINTNSILLPNVLFKSVPEDQVLPGDLVIWPSYDNGGPRPNYGHAMTVVSVYSSTDATFVMGKHKLLKTTREDILKHIEVVHCNARTNPATVRGQCRPPPQVKQSWRFMRPTWRYDEAA